MVNREYVKSRIDKLPEEIVIGIDKYINKKIKQNKERDKRNAEYLAKLDMCLQQLKEGKTVTFEMEELESMATMSHEEALKLVEKARARGKK